MNLYADYNFYVSEYKGQATEEEFQRQIVKASAHVRRITFGRADNCMEMEEVKLAACAVCDLSLIHIFCRLRFGGNGNQCEQ